MTNNEFLLRIKYVSDYYYKSDEKEKIIQNLRASYFDSIRGILSLIDVEKSLVL